jgi:hypothetical protein
MDPQVVTMLQRAGLDTAFPELLRIAIVLGEEGRILPLSQDLPVPVLDEEDQVVWVPLQPISLLWEGSRLPPDFSFAPPPEYEPFFNLLEATAADYCSALGRPERDKEFERIYQRLRRKPDGEDANPLFSYLQAASRLYLSLCRVSQAEFEAVAGRLRRSARTFALSLLSTNYHRLVLEDLHQA